MLSGDDTRGSVADARPPAQRRPAILCYCGRIGGRTRCQNPSRRLPESCSCSARRSTATGSIRTSQSSSPTTSSRCGSAGSALHWAWCSARCCCATRGDNESAPLFRRDRHSQSVELRRTGELTGEPRCRLDRERHVEHVDLGFAGRGEFVVPVLRHIDVTGGARAGAAAFRGNVEAAVAQDLHHRPAVAAFQFMRFAVAVRGVDLHATPSFFCRLEDDVVYWKRSFSFGRQIWKAACDANAASWKPQRISFNLP